MWLKNENLEDLDGLKEQVAHISHGLDDRTFSTTGVEFFSESDPAHLKCRLFLSVLCFQTEKLLSTSKLGCKSLECTKALGICASDCMSLYRLWGPVSSNL